MATVFYLKQQDFIEKLNLLWDMALSGGGGGGGGSYSTTDFSVYDITDSSKVIKFSASNLTTATTYTYSYPTASGQLASLANVGQTFVGTTTFSNANNTFGSSTAAGTIGLATGATVNGATKTVNIGTGGVAGSTTNINIGSTNGGTITFNGAAPVVPIGIKIGTGSVSSDVNTLDYYEEGTFTPVANGATSAGVGTYSVQTGKYTRVGNMVTFWLQLTITAHTGTGFFLIDGLPFACNSAMHVPTFFRWDSVTFSNNPNAYLQAGTTTIALERFAASGVPVNIALDSSCSVWLTGTYPV